VRRSSWTTSRPSPRTHTTTRSSRCRVRHHVYMYIGAPYACSRGRIEDRHCWIVQLCLCHLKQRVSCMWVCVLVVSRAGKRLDEGPPLSSLPHALVSYSCRRCLGRGLGGFCRQSRAWGGAVLVPAAEPPHPDHHLHRRGADRVPCTYTTAHAAPDRR
jgi:hypothetical protein